MNDSQSQSKAPWREWLLAGAIPGALGGTLLAGLLFHLNPELPFGFGSVVRATLLLGSVGAVVSVLLHIPLSSATWLRPRSL